MNHRKYVVLSASEADTIVFSEVLETSADTLRWSVDSSKTLVKFLGEVPDFLEGKTQNNHSEILEILRGPEWSAELDPV